MLLGTVTTSCLEVVEPRSQQSTVDSPFQEEYLLWEDILRAQRMLSKNSTEGREADLRLDREQNASGCGALVSVLVKVLVL